MQRGKRGGGGGGEGEGAEQHCFFFTLSLL